jgi:hypothetical protein
LSVMVSVSAMCSVVSDQSSVVGLSGARYDSSAQRARSCSWQRSLQNGRQAGSIGCRLQNTHNSTFDGPGTSAILPSCNRSNYMGWV